MFKQVLRYDDHFNVNSFNVKITGKIQLQNYKNLSNYLQNLYL